MAKTLTIYGIKNCDTMKKARAWLDKHGITYDFHDYKSAGIEREQLEALPGVGRKTASVVMSVAFERPEIAVDTHVFRVAHRLGLTLGKTPRDVERDLQAIVPREKWSHAHHWLILHGRAICKAPVPHCGECPVKAICPTPPILTRSLKVRGLAGAAAAPKPRQRRSAGAKKKR